MNKKLTICILLGFAAFMGHCNAQSIRLTSYRSQTNVTLDLNRAYNYNIYERNRWGMGIDLIQPLKYDKRYGRLFQNSFVASAYFGYGTGDHAWKYGGAVGLGFPRSVFRQISVCYQHDLLRVGSHSFEEYNIFNTIANSSYFSSRFSGVDRIGVVAQIDIPGPGLIFVDYNHSRERYLFDAKGPLYPALYEEDRMPYDIFNEVGIDLYWGEHWKFGVLADIWHFDDSAIEHDPLLQLHYLRFLAQYSNKIDFKDNHGQLSLFAQGGVISRDYAPLSRRFDLGGTGGGSYYFYNTFLTVRPNTFLADLFTLASIRYTTGWSIWKTVVSEPHPFVQLNAMWGMQYGKSWSRNTYYVNNTEMMFNAPLDGLLEPCVGIDGLLHWGVLDLGVAAAYQMTPKKTSYHLDNFLDKFAVMCVAKLII